MDAQLGEGFPGAVIREGADGGFERTFIRHKNILSSRGGDRLWWMRTGTVFCQAMYKGIEGKAWEALYSHY